MFVMKLSGSSSSFIKMEITAWLTYFMVFLFLVINYADSIHQPKALKLECGELNTENYSLYFKSETSLLSPFHDIPLYADEGKSIFNMIVEIPLGEQLKMEISRDHLLNPIKHDTEDGKIRTVQFPYPANYGAFPQTWENPKHKDINTESFGDNDPIDVVEIGNKKLQRGTVIGVKVLGIFALVDKDETDWKVVVVDANHEKANSLTNLESVEKAFPGQLHRLKEWFKTYKKPKLNKIALNEEVKDSTYAISIIKETNKFWNDLVMKKDLDTEINRENLSVAGSPFKTKLSDILNKLDEKCKKKFEKVLRMAVA